MTQQEETGALASVNRRIRNENESQVKSAQFHPKTDGQASKQTNKQAKQTTNSLIISSGSISGPEVGQQGLCLNYTALERDVPRLDISHGHIQVPPIVEAHEGKADIGLFGP